jgi:acetylglutamate kinase
MTEFNRITPSFRDTWTLQAGPILVKLGGAAIDQANDHPELFQAICDLHRRAQVDGSGVVLVHGGGKAVDRQLERLGFTTERRDGIRITPPGQIEQIVGVLAGSVNKSLVGHIQQFGVPAVGLCLSDGNFADCAKADHYSFDPGCVGEVRGGNPKLIDLLLGSGFLPVLSSIGLDEQGKALNINADDAAGALATVLGCRELILFTDVPGVLDASGRIIEELTAEDIEARIASGEISGGMIPKVRGALQAAREAKAPAVITAWNNRESLAKLAAGERVGTRVLHETPASVAVEASYAATPWSDLL